MRAHSIPVVVDCPNIYTVIEVLENRMEHLEEIIEENTQKEIGILEKIARKLDNTVLIEMVAKN